MEIMIGLIVASAALITSVAMICWKGITYHKKMEVIETKPQPTIQTRPAEMDDIERKLNQMDQTNQEHQAERQANAQPAHPDHMAPAHGLPMQHALKTIHDVFAGPELPDEGGK